MFLNQYKISFIGYCFRIVVAQMGCLRRLIFGDGINPLPTKVVGTLFMLMVGILYIKIYFIVFDNTYVLTIGKSL